MNSRFLRKKGLVATALSLMLSITICLSGCSSQGSLDLRMDLAGAVKSLDPQFVTDSVGRTVIANTFTGLVDRTPEGELVPAGAEKYTISDDGLVYRFELRTDMKWSNGDPVVAEDYRFALQRLFNPQVPSPFAEEYLNILNAREVLAGELPETSLGVIARDDYTLEIRLSEPSPVFLEKLAETAAMPCQQKFFESTRARYGLDKEYAIYNGPFYLRSWDNEKSLVLSPNPEHPGAEQPSCPNVVLYTARLAGAGPEEQLKLFLEGKSDVCPVTAQQLPQAAQNGVTSIELENRVWQLAFNQQNETLQNDTIRRSLAMSLNSIGYRERTPEMYGLADSLIPGSARMADLPLPELIPYNMQWAADGWAQGLEELEAEAPDKLTLMLPQDAQLETLAGYLQKQWRDSLGIYVNLETVNTQEYQQRLRSKKYSMAIQPIEAGGQSPSYLLDKFLSGSAENVTGFADPEFDRLIEEAAKASSPERAARLYGQAEQLLIDRSVAVPLLTQSSYYLFGPGTSGVELHSGQLIFADAVRIIK